ncbi:glycerophosphodiester phosphodiesterase [Chlorogloeopsis fritschii PCC 9212]|uniref:Putative glycerophosphoryl diester phosphodiesterase YhdW n=1 Tax=Chlorogloeopsis fritschii PCC 6912 TaxID=211165 RepID=A0A433N3J6_CHLFR|nr:glycerophosphodiester phosphodiesterase family protein [Chlorogloeopsis fritschii]RUR75778.1 putative glycerophosphoryl diester phosphodiesterase YhdW [Chlorogloeopsis fritschii PCC 6912]
MQVIGHRGAASLAPENTWEGFDIALSVGADAIETDVRATSDGELILIHDKHLDRTTNGEGLVQLTPWSVVGELDAGSWFSEEYRGAKIPLLRDTLARYGNSTHLVLEIKQPGIELRVLEMVQEFGLIGAVTFTSFDFPVVQNIKTQLSAAKVGFLTPDISDENIMQAVEAGMNQICLPANAVSQELVSRCKQLGLEVRAWKVKDAEVMISALKAGVDGMTVDFPHLLLAELGRQAK